VSGEERVRRPFRTTAEQHEKLAERLKKGRVRRTTTFSSGQDLLGVFWKVSGANEDRVAILQAIWEREVGAYAAHWKLEGVRRGVVFVRARSSAAAQELSMRSRELVRNLNKHFRVPWLKAIKFKV
jgi:Dna[CI] antecedent DciA-like protein